MCASQQSMRLLQHNQCQMTHRDTLCWVVGQHFQHEVDALSTQSWEDLVEILWLPLRPLVPATQTPYGSRSVGLLVASEEACALCTRATSCIQSTNTKAQEPSYTAGQYPPVPQPRDTWPVVLIRCAKQLEDVQQLLQLAITWKQGLLHQNKGQNIHQSAGPANDSQELRPRHTVSSC
eukprot:365376-Chlamydomonas_euryale.AAC.4